MKKRNKERVRAKRFVLTKSKFWVFLICALITGALLGVLSFTTFAVNSSVPKNVPTTCSDSDTGFDIEARGVCHDLYGNHIDRCIMIGTQRYLEEYSCLENACILERLKCEDYGFKGSSVYSSCYLGACHK